MTEIPDLGVLQIGMEQAVNLLDGALVPREEWEAVHEFIHAVKREEVRLVYTPSAARKRIREVEEEKVK